MSTVSVSTTSTAGVQTTSTSSSGVTAPTAFLQVLPAAFLPSISFGPCMCLLSDVGVTLSDSAHITGWTDQTANAISFTTGTQIKYSQNGIYGLPSLGSLASGEGNGLVSSVNGNVILPSSSGELFMVLQGISTSTTAIMQHFGNSGSICYAPFSDNDIYLDFNSTSRPQIVTNIYTSPVLVNVISTSAEFTVNVSGSQVYHTSTNTTGMPASTATIMGQAGSGWYGLLSVVIIFPYKLAPEQRNSVHVWAQKRYGVA